MTVNKYHDQEYKVQAVKLAKEIGQAKVAREPGIPKNTLYTWVRASRLGTFDSGSGSQTPKSVMFLNEEITNLRQRVKKLDKKICRLKEENEFLEEDEHNDTYGRARMYDALLLKQPEHVNIFSERTLYRLMEEAGISHRLKCKLNGITKADKEARKSENLLKRDFNAGEPLTKCVTDITEIKLFR